MNDVSQTPNADAGKTPVDLIAEFIALRDGKKAADDTYKAWVEENYSNRMDHLEMKLLETLNAMGVQSLSGPDGTGTVYKKLTTSVTIADATEFRRHVIGVEAWDLIDWRANKTGVQELLDKNEPLPPGVNYSQFFTVGIRKK